MNAKCKRMRQHSIINLEPCNSVLMSCCNLDEPSSSSGPHLHATLGSVQERQQAAAQHDVTPTEQRHATNFKWMTKCLETALRKTKDFGADVTTVS